MALLATSFALQNPAVAQSNDIRTLLKQTTECMFEVLKATPEVSDPKLGVTTSEGWAHPYLEYRAAEALSKFNPIRFDAKKADRGGFWFLAVKSGLGAPEFHVTEAVIKKWKVQYPCCLT